MNLTLGGGGGACPPPSFIHIYIPLHSITISACTFIITALHVFYRCLGYHIYIHVSDPPTILRNHPAIYIQYMHQIYVHILRSSHSLQYSSFPPKILILDRTQTGVWGTHGKKRIKLTMYGMACIVSSVMKRVCVARD